MNPRLLALLVPLLVSVTRPGRALDVMAWVPPYAVAACRAAVEADFGAHDARDGLTRVGLQFWVPRTDGSIKFADHEAYRPSDADVAWWRGWGQSNGVKILLTVFNINGTTRAWDWSLARSAFGTNRAVLVSALVTEMDRLNLDGIDVDFEGVGTFETDRAAFAQFVHELSVAVKARNKVLTVDSFHYIWNAPNQEWWPDWLGDVHGIHTMGYDDLYEGGTGYHKYSFQQNTGIAAGYAAGAVLLGFPSWVDSWGVTSGRGTTALAHVQEVRLDLAQPAGIAIWDLQLTAAAWRTSTLWAEIAAIKGQGGVSNRPPVAIAQSVTVTRNTSRAITLAGSDPDGNALTFALVSGPAHGTLSGLLPNPTYSPASNYLGGDAFTFAVSDAQFTSSPATVSISVSDGPGPLPAGWSTTDIGAVETAGSAGYTAATGTFSLGGSGLGLAGTADQFRYAWQTLSGDGEIRARISALSGPSTALAGVMIRESTAAGSAHHFLGRRSNGSLAWIRRSTTGRSTSTTTGAVAALPGWVRLVRTGTSIVAYTSANGVDWVRFNSAKLSVASQVTCGLVVTSGSNSSAAGATLDGVSVVP